MITGHQLGRACRVPGFSPPPRDPDPPIYLILPTTLAQAAVRATIDVALDDGNGVAGRVVLWDGPEFDAALAPTIACVFAYALQAVFPGQNYTTIGVWQARRQYREEVPFATAIGRTAAAHQILAAM